MPFFLFRFSFYLFRMINDQTIKIHIQNAKASNTFFILEKYTKKKNQRKEKWNSTNTRNDLVEQRAILNAFKPKRTQQQKQQRKQPEKNSRIRCISLKWNERKGMKNIFYSIFDGLVRPSVFTGSLPAPTLLRHTSATHKMQVQTTVTVSYFSFCLCSLPSFMIFFSLLSEESNRMEKKQNCCAFKIFAKEKLQNYCERVLFTVFHYFVSIPKMKWNEILVKLFLLHCDLYSCTNLFFSFSFLQIFVFSFNLLFVTFCYHQLHLLIRIDQHCASCIEYSTSS